jgi:hypothetical protein
MWDQSNCHKIQIKKVKWIFRFFWWVLLKLWSFLILNTCRIICLLWFFGGVCYLSLQHPPEPNAVTLKLEVVHSSKAPKQTSDSAWYLRFQMTVIWVRWLLELVKKDSHSMPFSVIPALVPCCNNTFWQVLVCKCIFHIFSGLCLTSFMLFVNVAIPFFCEHKHMKELYV